MKQTMPSLTIAALFREVFPKHSFLVSGNPQTLFNWVRVISTENEVSEKVTQGELVLISPQLFGGESDPTRALTQVIARLVQARVPAFAIQGSVGVASLEDALRNDMAVIFLPDEAVLETIERLALRMLTDQQALIDGYEKDLQQAISRPGNTQQNVVSLVQMVAQLLGRPVVLHDSHNLRINHAFPPHRPVAHVRWRQHLSLLDDDKFQNQDLIPRSELFSDMDALENNYILRIPLISDTETIGYLSIIKDERSFDEFAPMIIKRATTLCSQQLNKYLSGLSSDEISANWIANWLHNPPSNDVLLAARAEQQGFDVEQTYVLMVMRFLPLEKTTRPISARQFMEYVANETRTRRINALVGQYADRTVMFLPLERAQHTGRMKQYAENICARLAEQLGGAVVGGVGRPGVGLTELRLSFSEAERAQVLTEQLWDGTQTKFFGDLRLSELLMSISDIHRLVDFYTDWLSSILDYDQESRSDLLLTMAAYFANNGNMAATAKQLNVHRNTLVYRLNRIAEITQLDMDDANVQLNLHLAIKAYQLLRNLDLIP